MFKLKNAHRSDSVLFPSYDLFYLLRAGLLIILIAVVGDISYAADTKIPRVRHSVKPLDLSTPPTSEEMMAAGQLGGQLYPTHEIADKEKEKNINLSFGEAIQEWNKHEYKKAVKMFRKHVEDYPDSPWASEAVLHAGCDAQYTGQYSEAEVRFTSIIENNRGKDHEGAKILTNKATLRLGVLKVYQNNFKEAKEHFSKLKSESSDWRDRTYAAHWIQRLSSYSANELAMVNCGNQALAYLLEKDGKSADARKVLELLPENLQGSSIKSLAEMATQYGYQVSAIRASSSDIRELPLPAIMHISGNSSGDRGHYWILDRIDGNNIGLFDPQSGRRFEQSTEEFSKEWSGNALVFADKGAHLPGTRLAETETNNIYGGCCGVPTAEDNLGDPGLNGKYDNPLCGNNSIRGAPAWSVNMVNMNLYVADMPLWYSSPIEPSVEIMLSYNSQSAIVYNEPFGNKWHFSYGSYLVVDTGGQVTIFMPDGRRDVYSPDGSGGYLKPAGVFNVLTKIAENYFTLKFPDDSVYEYNIPSGTVSLQPFLIKISDRYGQNLTFGYDTDVNLTTITDAVGLVTTLTYNADGLAIQVRDPFDRVASFEYDANKNLVKITDMGGYATTFSYDQNVYLKSLGNTKGNYQFYLEPADGIYNGSNPYPPPGTHTWANYRITVTNPLGQMEEYQYNGYSAYSWYISPRHYKPYVSGSDNNFASRVPMTTYNLTRMAGAGRISRVNYPEGGYEAYAYDSQTGQRTSVTDSHGHVTSYTYNPMGFVTSATDAKQKTTAMTYGANNVDLIGIINGLGTISNTYDSHHNVASTTDGMGNNTYHIYNDFGKITTSTDALDTVTNYIYYDASQPGKYRLKEATRDGKTLQSFTYDAVGRVKTHTDSTGLTLTYAYDNLDQMTSITYPDGRQESYSYVNWCPKLIDAQTDRSSLSTSYSYDPLKRLTGTRNPDDTVVGKQYDADGNIVGLIDSNNNKTAYEYDSGGRLIKKTYADGHSDIYTYDGAGLLTRKTSGRGITTSYTYDANHNLTGISYSDSTPGILYSYDDYNRITTRTDGIGIYAFTYNNNSRLTAVDGPWENDLITYGYDALGRRTSIEPQGGEPRAYDFDIFGRVTAVKAGARAYTYTYPQNSASPIPVGLTRPNGNGTTYQYDLLNRLTAISNQKSNSDIITANAFTYNALDVRGTETVTNGDPITLFTNNLTTYNYNTVNQLLASSSPSRTFAYDNDGNMTKGYTPEGYVYAAAYDGENRLTSVSYTDSSSATHNVKYYYSGDDFLARQLVDGIETRFVRDEYLPLQERDGNNAVTRSYVWGLDKGGGIEGLVELDYSGQQYNYLYDGKGNVRCLIDGSQNVAAAYTYDTFGNLMSEAGTLEQPFKFSTKSYYENTGLSYYGYRFYSSLLGRWITRDPLEESGGINMYEWVGGNPINFADVLGLLSEHQGMIGSVINSASNIDNFISEIRKRNKYNWDERWDPRGRYRGWQPWQKPIVCTTGVRG